MTGGGGSTQSTAGSAQRGPGPPCITSNLYTGFSPSFFFYSRNGMSNKVTLTRVASRSSLGRGLAGAGLMLSMAGSDPGGCLWVQRCREETLCCVFVVHLVCPDPLSRCR